MTNPNGMMVSDTPNVCCGTGGGNVSCQPPPVFVANGIIGYPNVTAYIGQLPTSLDGQITQYLYAGLRVETNIGGYAQSWVVQNLGPNQQTETDGNGNYAIIRGLDTAYTGLCFVALQ